MTNDFKVQNWRELVSKINKPKEREAFVKVQEELEKSEIDNDSPLKIATRFHFGKTQYYNALKVLGIKPQQKHKQSKKRMKVSKEATGLIEMDIPQSIPSDQDIHLTETNKLKVLVITGSFKDVSALMKDLR